MSAFREMPKRELDEAWTRHLAEWAKNLDQTPYDEDVGIPNPYDSFAIQRNIDERDTATFLSFANDPKLLDWIAESADEYESRQQNDPKRVFAVEALPYDGPDIDGVPALACIRIVRRADGREWIFTKQSVERPCWHNSDKYALERLFWGAGLLQGEDLSDEEFEAVADLLPSLDSRECGRPATEIEVRPDAAMPQPALPGPALNPTPPPIMLGIYSPIKATPFVWRDPSIIPPREWLYGRHMARKYVSTTVAPGGVGKSSLALVEALAMATGRNLIGHHPSERLRVWCFNLEDPREELERRIAATCLHYGIAPHEIDGRLFIDSGREMEMKIAVEDKSGFKVAAPVVDAVKRAILDNGIDVMIVDPFVSSHSVNENDNMKIDTVLKTWASIAERTDCAIELVHHVRKSAHGQFQHTVDDGRGAGSMMAAVRSARVLNVMSEDEASKFGVKQRRAFFRIDNGKANLAPPPEKSDWHQLVSVDLGNSTADRPADQIGVVARWTPPNPFDEVTSGHLDQVMKLVSEGDYRESSQSADWAGYAHVLAQALVQVLRQCRDDLTRENVMRQAANMKDLHFGMLLPGITVNTGPDDFAPIKQMRMRRFTGEHWEMFGPVFSA